MRISGLLASIFTVVVTASCNAAELPQKTTMSSKPLHNCEEKGQGYYYLPGVGTCVRLGGAVRSETGVQAQSSSLGTQPKTATDLRTRLQIREESVTDTAAGPLRTVIQGSARK